MTGAAPSDRASCPQCGGELGSAPACTACGQAYPWLASLRVLLQSPAAHVEHWQRQLGLLLQQGEQTTGALEAQAARPDLAAATATRLRALARAIGEQVAEIARVIQPALGAPLPPAEGVGLPRGAADYLTCLFRDWAWSDGQDEENQRSLAAIQRVSGGQPLGRTLVLGAGGCRLAYDLHVHCGGTVTGVVDVDPFLLIPAETLIRGTPVVLTESSVNAPEVDPVSRRWTMSAPAGPLPPERFQFFLANGLAPPFADQSFDTVVTPWFIDQVPTDLPDLLRRLHGLLVPGGRWINHGPLIYRPDALPVERWYTRQEIFELAGDTGFRLGAWEAGPQPHFVSPLTGRGLIENVLTFAATRSLIRT